MQGDFRKLINSFHQFNILKIKKLIVSIHVVKVFDKCAQA